MRNVTDEDLAGADAAIVTARASYDACSEGRRQLEAERQQLLEKASAAERERADLDARRRALLPRLRDEEATIAPELHAIGADLSRARARAGDYHEAAELLAPGIAALNAPREQARLALRVAEYRKPWLVHRWHSQELHAALSALGPEVSAWLASAAVLEQAHQEAFGHPTRLVDPIARLAQALSVWAWKLLPAPYSNHLLRRWPDVNGSLLAPLETIAPARYEPGGDA